MRKLSSAAVVIIMGVALYFAVVWGYEGLRMLTSSSYGLEDVWRSQFVFAIGSVFGLGPIGLIKLAAFFGALKLAVASICAVPVLDRLRALVRGKTDSEILEAGLILVVLISILSVGLAVWSQKADLVREQTIQWGALVLAVPLRPRGFKLIRFWVWLQLVRKAGYLALASSAITSAASLKA